MPHNDYVILSAEGVGAQNLYLVGPVVPELAEIQAPKIADVASEEDRRVGPSTRAINSFVDGLGIQFLDQGPGLWDARNVWTLEEGRVTPRPKLAGTDTMTSSWEFTGVPTTRPMFMTTDPDDSTEYLYYLVGDRIFKLNEAGTPTQLKTVTNALNGRTILEFKQKDAANRRLFAFFHTFTAPRANYWYSAHDDYDDWAAGDGGRVLTDALIFRDFLLAADDSGKIVYSTTGLNGSWNDTDAADGEPVIDMGLAPIQFVGVANAPWGRPAPYFLHRGVLYALAYDAREYHEIPLQNSLRLHSGTIWQGQVVVHDGFNVYAYDPATQKSKAIGMPGERSGRPFSFQYGVQHLFTAGPYLCAVMNRFAGTSDPYQVLFYTGRGWHSIYSDYDVSPTIDFGWAGAAFAWRDASWTQTAPQVFVIGAAALTGAAGSMYLQQWNMPQYGEGMVNDAEDVAYTSPTDAYFDTPWLRIYADLDGVCVGVLVHATMPAATASTIRLEYRTTQGGSWTALGEMAVGEVPFKFMPFGSADGDSLYGGIDFREVQLRVRFYTAAAGTNAKWPELLSLVPVFSKHTTRMRWSFVIDVAQTAGEETGAAVLQNFSDILKHIKDCIDNPLAKLEIPNLTKSRGTIVAMTTQHEGFYRDNQTGGDHNVVSAGQIRLVFEEVAPRESDGFHAQQLPS